MATPYFPSLTNVEYDFLKPKPVVIRGSKPPKIKQVVNWRAGKPVTCALACITPTGKVLIVHATNGGYKQGWGFPKGIKDATDANELAAARRELKEETSLDLPDDLLYINCGTFYYTKDKLYRLFAVKLDFEIDLSTLRCDSMVPNPAGSDYPEIDAFDLVPIDRCYRQMSVKQLSVVKSCLTPLRMTYRGTAKDTRNDWER